MTDAAIVLTLAGSLGAALLFGYITQRLGLSPIVGYLIAGVAIGPNTPGLVADSHIAEQFAEVGVILLMFGVGLQFHLEELLAVRRIAIPGALAQGAIATALGAVVARGYGWTWSAAGGVRTRAVDHEHRRSGASALRSTAAAHVAGHRHRLAGGSGRSRRPRSAVVLPALKTGSLPPRSPRASS